MGRSPGSLPMHLAAAVSAAAASVIPEEGMDASAIGENGRISVSEGKAVLIADDGTEKPLPPPSVGERHPVNGDVWPFRDPGARNMCI